MERVAIGSRYANYAAELLRTPSAFKARSAATFGLRSPLAITLTIAFAIRSLIGSSGLLHVDQGDETSCRSAVLGILKEK